MPEISVIMPSYQHARFLPEAIDSVLLQTFTDIELIIIDDGSRDGSQKIIRNYAIRDPRIIPIFHPSNQGIPRTVNDGLARAKGSFVAFIASDDIWARKKLEIQYQVLLNDRDMIIWSEAEIIDEKSRSLNTTFSKFCPALSRRRTGNLFQDLLWGNYILGSTMMLSRESACEVGFSEDLHYLNDYRFIVDLAYKHQFLWIGKPLVRYRVHNDNSQNSAAGGHNKDLAPLSRYFLAKYGSELPKNLRLFLIFRGTIWNRLFISLHRKATVSLIPQGNEHSGRYHTVAMAGKHMMRGQVRHGLHVLRSRPVSQKTDAPDLQLIKDNLIHDDDECASPSRCWRWETCYGTGHDKEGYITEEWKMSVVDDVMYTNIIPGGTILEMGPGAGRWSEYLQKIAGHLILMDISDLYISICRKRFVKCQNISYQISSGFKLDSIPDESIDFIWSFDVLVTINPRDIDKYIQEFARVLKPGGKAVVRHANNCKSREDQSTTTAGQFTGIVCRNGLNLVNQFDSWGDGFHNLRCSGDVISVFMKAADTPQDDFF
jgi:glycosyltransferase involved in cell wall biosynthesis/SAM-dependent methyltransferase